MKKAIQRLLDRLQVVVTKIDEYNEYLNDNSYNHRYQPKELSFDVKSYAGIDKDNLEELDRFKVLSDTNKELVLAEFDDDRMSDIWSHTIDDLRECHIEDLANGGAYGGIFKHMNREDISFQGRSGGHLCLGAITEWEAELNDIGLCDYPFYQYIRNEGCQWIHPDDIDTAIAELKEHFNVTTQKEVYKLLKADIVKDFEPYIADLDKKMEQFLILEADIKQYKGEEHFKSSLLSNLEYEVERFIEDNFSYEYAVLSAEQGDYSLLDSVLKIEGDKVVTNRSAVVSLKAAIEVIKHIDEGKDVKSEKVSAYTINVVDRREKDTYVKIGCHLFSLRQTKLQLLINQ